MVSTGDSRFISATSTPTVLIIVVFQMAFIFVFNLLLGAGALALPAAFAEAGWIVSTILLCVLCFARYETKIRLKIID